MYLKLNPVAGPQASQLRTYSVTYSNMDALTVTATGSADDIINQLHAPNVNHLTIDLSRNTGNSQVNVLDVLAEGATAQSQSVSVRTGAGADQVTVFAAQPNHAFNVTTGAGNDELTLNALSNVAFQSFTADLGTGDDIARSVQRARHAAIDARRHGGVRKL